MIQLVGGLAIGADEYSYAVGFPERDKKGTVRLKKAKYYGSITQAISGTLERVLRQGVADGTISNLQQFIREQERLHSELEKLLAPLEPKGTTQPSQGIPKATPAPSEGRYTPGPSNVYDRVLHGQG